MRLILHETALVEGDPLGDKWPFEVVHLATLRVLECADEATCALPRLLRVLETALAALLDTATAAGFLLLGGVFRVFWLRMLLGLWQVRTLPDEDVVVLFVATVLLLLAHAAQVPCYLIEVVLRL